MTVRELIDYLSGFGPEQSVSALILNLKTRQAYSVAAYQLVVDAGCPVLLFELGEPEPLDDVVEGGPQ